MMVMNLKMMLLVVRLMRMVRMVRLMLRGNRQCQSLLLIVMVSTYSKLTNRDTCHDKMGTGWVIASNPSSTLPQTHMNLYRK
ncbi:hypothetical protein FHS14_006429 [Paenibacillus baekrokdamisoli]|nr:hypothetical protein [Paenibacillus baekrokdamisoli]